MADAKPAPGIKIIYDGPADIRKLSKKDFSANSIDHDAVTANMGEEVEVTSQEAADFLIANCGFSAPKPAA